MKLARILGAAASLAAALPLQAQQAARPSIRLTPYVGYMSFGSLVSGPLGSKLTNGGGPAYGAQVSVPLADLPARFAALNTSKDEYGCV